MEIEGDYVLRLTADEESVTNYATPIRLEDIDIEDHRAQLDDQEASLHEQSLLAGDQSLPPMYYQEKARVTHARKIIESMATQMADHLRESANSAGALEEAYGVNLSLVADVDH